MDDVVADRALGGGGFGFEVVGGFGLGFLVVVDGGFGFVVVDGGFGFEAVRVLTGGAVVLVDAFVMADEPQPTRAPTIPPNRTPLTIASAARRISMPRIHPVPP